MESYRLGNTRHGSNIFVTSLPTPDIISKHLEFYRFDGNGWRSTATKWKVLFETSSAVHLKHRAAQTSTLPGKSLPMRQSYSSTLGCFGLGRTLRSLVMASTAMSSLFVAALQELPNQAIDRDTAVMPSCHTQAGYHWGGRYTPRHSNMMLSGRLVPLIIRPFSPMPFYPIIKSSHEKTCNRVVPINRSSHTTLGNTSLFSP